MRWARLLVHGASAPGSASHGAHGSEGTEVSWADGYKVLMFIERLLHARP